MAALRALALGLGALLAACASLEPAPVEDRSPEVVGGRAEPAPPPPPAEHVRVAPGDTLYGIAFRLGLDWRELARWNGIEAPYIIRPGERLRVRPPPAEGEGGRRAAATRPLASPEREVRREALPAPAPSAPVPAAGPRAAEGPRPSAAVATRPGGEGPSAPPPVAAAAEPARPDPDPALAPAAPAAGEGRGADRPPPGRVVEGIRWSWPAQGELIRRFASGDPLRQGIDIAGRAGDPVYAAADGEVVYSGAGLVGYGELIIIRHGDRHLSAYGHNRRRLVAEGERVRAGQPIAEMGRTGADRDKLHFEIRRDGRPVDPLRYLPER